MKLDHNAWPDMLLCIKLGFALTCSVQKLWLFDTSIYISFNRNISRERNSSYTTGRNLMKLYHNAWPDMLLCIKVGFRSYMFRSEVMAL
jgi:hypothetical protein